MSIAAAIVRFEGETPRLAEAIWPSHPQVLRSLAMAQIGQAAALGQLPSAETMERLRKLADRAPFEPQPFLVEAALAQKRGESARAGQLLLEGRRRDPRSPGARYLLADHLIRNGDIVGGLKEMTVLSRLVRGAADQLVPGLAAYARTPGAIPQLKQLFRESPDLEPMLLLALASDAESADLVLAIAQSTTVASNTGKWRSRLLKSLVDAGMYAKAYSIWARFAGVNAPPSGLYRPDFTPSPAPPPFNWALAQAGGGLAEPSPGGGLRVIHYGRKKVALASQLILLQPGRYALSMAVTGDAGSDGQLRWRVRCLPSRNMLLEVPLTRANAQKAGGQFEVPGSGCAGQQIEL
ncbi:MAG: hypothetical protein H0U34_01285, partial [Sphingomonas sp.]|nr:hypothetical protein [Sphingomonas sp.]